MPTINSSQPFPIPDQYWDLVKRVLKEVLEMDSAQADDLTDALRREISRCPSQEQLLFYHVEPLSVAGDIWGEQINHERQEAYRKLSGKWWLP